MDRILLLMAFFSIQLDYVTYQETIHSVVIMGTILILSVFTASLRRKEVMAFTSQKRRRCLFI